MCMRQEEPTNFEQPRGQVSRLQGPVSRWKRLVPAFTTVLGVISLAAPLHAQSHSSINPSEAASSGEVAAGYPDCDRPPSESDVTAAKGAFQAGKTSFEEGDYERAILYWDDAFRRDCTAVKLLLNVARAYELNGDLDHAVIALETYVEREPELDDRDAVERRIDKLKARAERERAQSTSPAAAPPSDTHKQTAPTSDGDATPKHDRPIWPVVATAAGVAGIAVGSTFAALGQIAVSNEKDRIAEETVQVDGSGDPVIDPDTGEPLRCTRKGLKWDCPTSELADAVDAELDGSKELKRAKTTRTVGIVVAGGGAAITIVGAYFWYTLWKSAPASATATLRPVLLPVVAPGYQGVSFSARF